MASYGRFRLDPNTPRHGKFSLNDIREHLGYWKKTYGILAALEWQVPRLYLFTPEEAYTILMFHYTAIGREMMRRQKFQKLMPKPDGRPIRDDPHDIMPPEPYTPQPKGFALSTGRSLTRPKQAGPRKTPPPSKRADPKE